MSQEHEDIKCTYPWYFYFGFVFLMMLRMAKYFLHFSTKFLISITKFLVVFLHDGFQWILWWSRLMFLLLLYYAGWLFSPLYFNLFFIFDVKLMTVGHKRGPTYPRLSQLCLHRGHKYLWRQFGLPTSLNNEFQSCIRKHTSHLLAIES